MATTRRLTKKEFLSSFAILCYLSFGAFLLEGHGGKVSRSKKIYNTKLHVYKNVSFIIKGILCTVMEAFCTYNLRLPGVTEQVVEIPGEVIQQNRGQKNAALSLSFSVGHAKNTRAYGSIFQHLNILGSLEDRKKR